MSSTAASLRTNRDLYLFATALAARYDAPVSRSLEAYLRALHRLASRQRDRPTLPLAWFAHLLEAAFTEPPAGFDPAWTARAVARFDASASGFARWELTLIAQVVDLRAMAAAGTLADPQRYFGLDAPSGARWYNFVPSTYLECGLVGCLGGWSPGDATGRAYVPEPEPEPEPEPDEHSTGRDDDATAEPIFEITEVSWDVFADVLECGQMYE